MTFFDDVFTFDAKKCKWLPVNQFLFQLANFFLVLTYFVKPNSLSGLMQLRFALMMAGLCFGLWGGIIICALDCLIWNIAFSLGNAIHLIYLFIKTRPAKFTPDHEKIYSHVFYPLGIKRFQYNELALLSTMRHLNNDDHYATKGITKVNSIAIIATGSILVKLDNHLPTSHIDELEFVDSPEWIAFDDKTLNTYQVSLIAQVPTTVYLWEREALIRLFKCDSMMKNVFDSLIGKDICKKLFSLHQTFLTSQPTQHIASISLHQASLLTYSAINLFHVTSNEVSPYSSPRECHDLMNQESTNTNEKIISEQDLEIYAKSSTENSNLISLETNL